MNLRIKVEDNSVQPTNYYCEQEYIESATYPYPRFTEETTSAKADNFMRYKCFVDVQDYDEDEDNQAANFDQTLYVGYYTVKSSAPTEFCENPETFDAATYQ